MTIPFSFGIDGQQKLVHLTVGEGDKATTTFLDSNDIAKFIATLSQMQHALVMARAGETPDLPIDPEIAFQKVGGTYLLVAYEVLRRFAVGADDQAGAVSLVGLSRTGRLTGYHMSPESARKMGQALLEVADQMAGPQTKQ